MRCPGLTVFCCKQVWNTLTGEELLTLEGHKNVVYAIAFNNPYGDKVITGSFDKTCKLWNSNTGELYHTLRGHATEIVCLSFNPQGSIISTGSMDNTAKLWDTETGEELCTLLGRTLLLFFSPPLLARANSRFFQGTRRRL